MEYEAILFNSPAEREKLLKEFYTQHIGEIGVRFLINNGFLTALASRHYHGNYEGGLFDHSVNVAETLATLTINNNLKWERESSPYVIGLLHDLCKIDQYVKVDGEYQYNDTTVVKGHGVKSLIYAQCYGIRLTEEERACIIYHMGAFGSREEQNDYSNAIHKFPNVLWTHTADMIASQIIGV